MYRETKSCVYTDREIERWCVCVCVERERERERGSVYVER